MQTAAPLQAYSSSLQAASWQDLNPELPDIPITDVIPEHDKLAMASNRRGSWGCGWGKLGG